jgi:signal transduction histidine kinase
MSGHVQPRAVPTRQTVGVPRISAREAFAGYVAHELRTPLATQRSLLELALADPNAKVSDWRDIGADVLRACRQQERVLEACLALSFSETGLHRREEVDLAVIAAAALNAHDLSMLESVEAFEPALTTGDPDLLARLAANLISNAIRYNIPGGRIEIATGTHSKRAVLSVANTGPPVPTDELPRLFQPFQRIGSNTGSYRNGVGLGLAIVAAVAAAHNAVLRAGTRLGGGLEVEISFPVPKQPPPYRTPKARHQVPRLPPPEPYFIPRRASN